MGTKAWIGSVLLSATVLVFLGCSRTLDPGLYRLEGAGVDGFLRIGVDSLGNPVRLLYWDHGAPLADTLSAGLAVRSGKTILSLPDSTTWTVSLTPYTPPEFILLPERTLYQDPVYEVGETRDIVYGRILSERNYQDLTLDLYCPLRDHPASRPLLVMFHDGDFHAGDKRDSSLVEWCRYFSSLGYVVSSVNYRQGDSRNRSDADHLLLQSLRDAHAAVRFLLRRDSLLIHPDRIFAGGMGAGAITALDLAYVRDKDLPETIREEGDSVEIVRAALVRGADIHAVANLWGAVPDTAILDNARIPVISFQSREDPVIPFGEGYPFENTTDQEDGFGLLREAWEAIMSLIFPESEYHVFRTMYGAGTIHRILGRGSELHAFDGDRHDLIHKPDGEMDYPLFDEIKEQTAHFFSSNMETNPVSLQQDPEDPQRFFIDATEVESCYWKVEGGAVTVKGPDAVRVLLFPDAPSHAVTVSGAYLSGLTFNETVGL